jgi:hypothetical protein
MANIFTLENISDFSEKLNIDDLYEKKKQYDLNKLTLYNKILNRIHVRIKTTARQKIDEQFCWFVVPEVMIGVPKYDNAQCISYLLDKIKDNGFNVRYIHPNTLFISWQHWVPSYVRTELKKKTGIVVDEYGNRVEDEPAAQESLETGMFKLNDTKPAASTKPAPSKKFNSISSYKPQGSLVYTDELLSKLENKFN